MRQAGPIVRDDNACLQFPTQSSIAWFFTMKTASLVSCIALLICQSFALAIDGRIPVEQTQQDQKVLVGINYFAGWWEKLPNKWHGSGRSAKQPDWRPQNPDRDPLLGIYNDQATMDREIVAAADYGVDFFSILWYFPVPGSRYYEANARLLNRGLETFLRSPNAHRLRFIIEYSNEPHFAATTDEQWDLCLTTWVAAMRHPSYLRVGGRLVFKVLSAGAFIEQNNNDLGRCRDRKSVV
jgi:hypothetical protein